MADPGLITWKVCDDSYYHGHIEKVAIVNNPVVPQNTTVIALGSLDKNITSGSWGFTASFAGIPVLHKEGDLCSDSVVELPLRSGAMYISGLNCPVNVGTVQVEQKAIFYQSPPPGKYSIRCKMVDQDNEPILCLDITIPMYIFCCKNIF